jgi:hypothetical protein
MQLMPLGIVPEFIAPGFPRQKQVVRQLLLRAIYEITLTEGKSSSSFLTIRVLHRPVAASLGMYPRPDRAASRLRRFGNLPSPLEDEK